MFNQDFYPTPESVSREMLKGFNLHNKKVLEPSAGKGDLAKAIQEKGNESYRKISVDVSRYSFSDCRIEKR